MVGYHTLGLPVPLDFGGIDDGTLCRVLGRRPNEVTGLTEAVKVTEIRPAAKFSLSEQAISLLQGIENLRLQPYDDQTQQVLTAWRKGATIGYGHLIPAANWDKFRGGLSQAGADALFDQDIAPAIGVVRSAIKVGLRQNQFDALVAVCLQHRPREFRAVLGGSIDQ